MQTPYIRDFAASLIQGARCFKAQSNLRYVKTAYGGLDFVCGGGAVVFRAVNELGEMMAVKCYRGVSPRRKEVYALLEERNLAPWGVVGKFYPQGLTLCCAGGCMAVDVLVAPWVEGVTLAQSVAELLRRGDTDGLWRLSEEFDRMAEWLMTQDWAHGDVTPDNIVVTDNGLRLIDFDAVYVAGVTEPRTEIGTLGYNHPLRTIDTDHSHIDDWALARISVALHALRLAPEWADKGVFPWPEGMFVRGGEEWESLCELFAQSGDALALRLCEVLTCRFDEPTWLGELFAERRVGAWSESEVFRGCAGWGVADKCGTTLEPAVWDDIVCGGGKTYGCLRDYRFEIENLTK